jgi:hypothetical protein
VREVSYGHLALAILLESRGVMIKQPLARAGNPLAAMDYHAIADEERELFHELVAPARHAQEPDAAREARGHPLPASDARRVAAG